MNSLLTNNSAMVALETLRGINKDLASVQAQISTGKSVANAKDNAAIWAISTVMSTDVESFKQISESLNKGSATVGVARNAAESVTDLIQDMKELVVSAQDDLNADDLIPVHRRADKHRRACAFAVQHFNGKPHGRVVGQGGDGQGDAGAAARGDGLTCDFKRGTRDHDQFRPDPSNRAASAAARRMAPDLWTVSMYSASASLS